MSTLYFCTFVRFLLLYFIRTFHTNFYVKSGVSSSKNGLVMPNLVFSAIPLLLQSRFCLKASRQVHRLHGQISPVPDVPQILFTPQNVAIDQGINLRVVLTPRIATSTIIVVEIVRITFILFVSHQTSLKVTAHTEHTHTS